MEKDLKRKELWFITIIQEIIILPVLSLSKTQRTLIIKPYQQCNVYVIHMITYVHNVSITSLVPQTIFSRVALIDLGGGTYNLQSISTTLDIRGWGTRLIYDLKLILIQGWRKQLSIGPAISLQ